MYKAIINFSAIILFVTFNSELKSQNFSHTIQNDTAYCNYNTDIDHAYSTFNNDSSDSLTLDIVRIEFNGIPIWRNGMCVGSECYVTSVDSVRFQIAPDSSVSFRSGFILYEDTTSTIAMARFQLKNISDPNEYLEFKTYAVNPINVATTNIQNFSHKVILYPNPTKDLIFIDTQIKIEKVELFSSQGILEHISNDNYLSLNRLNKGIYFAKIYSAEGIALKKIIKE